MDNFDYKKYLVENKLTSNSRMLNEDNLEVKNFAKQIYSFLVKNDVTTKLIASIPSAGSQGKQIGDKLTGGSNEGLVWYWDDPKTKQTVIEIHLAGGEKGVLEVEKKILSSFPNLEQYNRETFSGPDVFKVRFRVKEKTTAKGGLVGNTNEVENKLTLNSRLSEEETQNGTTYLTIKEPLTKAMEAMGYEKPPLESDNFATAYSSLSYVKPLSDTETLEVEVRPAPEKGKVANKEFGSDFEEEGKTDYPVITFEMYVVKTEEQEDKKFFGLVKKKYQDQSYDYIVRPTYLDLSKNTTEGAVSKITSLVKQKEPK
jgi:hypothetical protein